MEIIITGLFTIILLGIYALSGFAIAMLIQLVSYRVFKFNIYKTLYRKFMEV